MKKRNMKVLALLMTVTMAGTMLAGCGRSDGKEDEKGKNQAKSEGKVYYLNFKPEQADDWVTLAETYPAEQQMHQAMPQQHLPAQQMLPAKIPQVQMMW